MAANQTGNARRIIGKPHTDKSYNILRTFWELQCAPESWRITILQGDWQRADVLALMASVDCFVSLHRSEGFGLGMAEAMFLGKPVIGTSFSGNTEFLTEETGFPVPYHMRAVEQGEYPYSAGNSWAEPDIRTAAGMMRSVACRTDEVRSKALRDRPTLNSTTAKKSWVAW